VDRQGSGRRGEPGWREELCGFGGLATSCLRRVSLSARTISKWKWCRVTFEHVEADSTKLIDVGVEDLREKPNLGRGHGVVVWKKELELEDTSWSCID
jgi:hypothetical protein